MDFQKGAVWCACLYLFISLLLNRKINYKEVFLFSHYTLRMRKLIDRKNTDCFPLWRERGTIRQDGWWKVESSMLERRKACWCAPFWSWLSCLPISGFNADPLTAYRKFLRISNCKELWAMTRRHSRHSMCNIYHTKTSIRSFCRPAFWCSGAL